jgi:threonine synthase
VKGELRRFAAELPAVDEFVSLGEGDTPLLPLDAVARQLGIGRLSAKM